MSGLASVERSERAGYFSNEERDDSDLSEQPRAGEAMHVGGAELESPSIVRSKRHHSVEDEETSVSEKVMRVASVTDDMFYECLSNSVAYLNSGEFIAALEKLDQAFYKGFTEQNIAHDQRKINVIRYVSNVYSRAGHLDIAAQILEYVQL